MPSEVYKNVRTIALCTDIVISHVVRKYTLKFSYESDGNKSIMKKCSEAKGNGACS
jgi:hypothetical protein